jgi:hypothetical protein
MNLKNSRSHVIFTCVVEAWSKVKILFFLSEHLHKYIFRLLAFFTWKHFNAPEKLIPKLVLSTIQIISQLISAYWCGDLSYFIQLILQDFSSNGFSSSKTSKITFVDLAGLDIDELEGNGKNFTREERHVKKSLSTLGYVTFSICNFFHD